MGDKKYEIADGDELVLKRDGGEWVWVVRTPRRPSSPEGGFIGKIGRRFATADAALVDAKMSLIGA